MKRGIFECFQYPLASMRDASEFDVVNVMVLPDAADPPPPTAIWPRFADVPALRKAKQYCEFVSLSAA
jgi:hypothetical protein